MQGVDKVIEKMAEKDSYVERTKSELQTAAKFTLHYGRMYQL